MTHEVGAEVILMAQNDNLCPVKALFNHTRINHAAPSDVSLFAFRESSGCWSNMTRHCFLNFVSKIWDDADLAHISGHSFCIGGAVALLLAGVPPEVLAFLSLPVSCSDFSLSGCGSHWQLDFSCISSILAPYDRNHPLVYCLRLLQIRLGRYILFH